MSKPKVEIVVPERVHPGDTIKVRVIVDAAEPTVVDGVDLTVFGEVWNPNDNQQLRDRDAELDGETFTITTEVTLPLRERPRELPDPAHPEGASPAVQSRLRTLHAANQTLVLDEERLVLTLPCTTLDPRVLRPLVVEMVALARALGVTGRFGPYR